MARPIWAPNLNEGFKKFLWRKVKPISSVLAPAEVLSSAKSFFPARFLGWQMQGLARERDGEGPKAKVPLVHELGGKEMHPKIATRILGRGF